jgi:hypothetical protein
MTFLGAVDLPHRTIDDFRKALQDREVKLAAAKNQRDTIHLDMRKAQAAVDAGDKRARMELSGLNKSNLEVGRLILSIGREVSEAKGRLSLAENQAKAAAAKKAELDDAALVRDKWFECLCFDGVRKVRHRHSSIVALQRELQPGYRAIGQVFGVNEDGTGGFVADAKSNMMDGLLQAHGDTLLTFLAQHGIIGSDKQTVIVLPNNGRDLQ